MARVDGRPVLSNSLARFRLTVGIEDCANAALRGCMGAMDAAIQAGLDKAGLPNARRHLFLCIGPDCCATADGEAVWAHVKQRLREAGLPVMRTKAACFRVCQGGPWLVVYPEGIWYGGLDAARFDRILREHLIGGVPIAAWVVARNSLDGCGAIGP